MPAQRGLLAASRELTQRVVSRQAAEPSPPVDDRPSDGESTAGDNLSAFLAAAQEELRHEFAVSERLEGKSRTQVTLGVTVWAASQTVALAALGSGSVKLGGKITIGVLALIGLVAIAEAIRRSFAMWKARPQGGVSPEWIKTLVDSQRDDAVALGTMTKKYANLVDERRDLNADRAGDLEKARGWCLAGAGIAIFEVAVVVVFRLLAA